MSRARSGGGRRALRIRSGDHVKVIAGKDRGKSGRVLRVEPAKRRVYVEGLNMVKRHIKPTQVRDTTRGQSIGGVIDREGPIHISNVMLLDPKGRPTRVAVEREDGRRFRVAKSTGARLE
jgi:large subunit ribosomal protein L24